MGMQISWVPQAFRNGWGAFPGAVLTSDVAPQASTQYTRRLEKALNQLSDQPNTVQREAKLL